MVERDLTIADVGEFPFIHSIEEGSMFAPRRLVRGIGDDCAVIGPCDGKVLLATADLLVEDVHFRLAWTSPEDLGEKAVAVNLSDIAAMGGQALHILVSIAVPGSMSLSVLQGLYKGIRAISKRYRVNIVGGDTVRSEEGLFIGITALGEASEEEVLYRSGAAAGDRIYVTGTLGDAAAGLRVLEGDFTVPEPVAAALKGAHRLPVPCLEEGRLIAGSRLASAMIDLSDGLLPDLKHICEAGGVGARVFLDALPLSGEVRGLGERPDVDPWELALWGGEDYGLLITVPSQNEAALCDLFKEGKAAGIHRVGEITAESGIRLRDPEGRDHEPKDAGFKHF